MHDKSILILKFYFTIIVLILILIVGLRKIGVSVDDTSYFYLYQSSKQGNLRKDVLFFLFSNLLPNIHILFLFFALISIGLKSIYILNHSKYFGIAFLLYFSSLFFLHDFVQIRAGIASGLLLWILYYSGKEKLFLAFIISCAAIVAHLSALTFIPLIFLKRENTRNLFILLGIISLILGFFYPLDLNSFKFIFPELIFKRLLIFLDEEKSDVNLLNPIALIHYIFAILIFINWNRLIKITAHSKFVIKTFLIGLYMFLIFHRTGIGYRLYELFMIVQIPLIDIFIKTIKPKLVIFGIIILLSILYFFYYVIKYPVVTPYSFFF